MRFGWSLLPTSVQMRAKRVRTNSTCTKTMKFYTRSVFSEWLWRRSTSSRISRIRWKAEVVAGLSHADCTAASRRRVASRCTVSKGFVANERRNSSTTDGHQGRTLSAIARSSGPLKTRTNKTCRRSTRGDLFWKNPPKQKQKQTRKQKKEAANDNERRGCGNWLDIQATRRQSVATATVRCAGCSTV